LGFFPWTLRKIYQIIRSKMEQLISKLKQFQADSVVFYSTTHGFHWNVEGVLFTQYHAFFKEVYEDVYSTLDVIAEYLRKYDEYAPFALSEFMANARITEVRLQSTSPTTMAATLLGMNNIMLETIKDLFKTTQPLQEQGLANFLAERQDKHQFWGWWLRSSLREAIN